MTRKPPMRINPGTSATPRAQRHIIDDLCFAAGWLLCSCSETVNGSGPEALAAAFSRHRLAAGAGYPSTGVRRTDDAPKWSPA